MRERIHIQPDRCYGCRACELVCSYHLHGEFSPSKGAIRVFKDNKTGNIELSVNAACDLCTLEDHPLCVRYCSYRALSLRRQRGTEK